MKSPTRHPIEVDGVDGIVHHADAGHLPPEFMPDKGMIVTIENKAVEDSDKQRTRVRILSPEEFGRQQKLNP